MQLLDQKNPTVSRVLTQFIREKLYLVPKGKIQGFFVDWISFKEKIYLIQFFGVAI